MHQPLFKGMQIWGTSRAATQLDLHSDPHDCTSMSIQGYVGTAEETAFRQAEASWPLCHYVCVKDRKNKPDTSGTATGTGSGCMGKPDLNVRLPSLTK